MKFSIDRDCFAKTLKKVDSICAKSGNFAILSGCLIEANNNQIIVTGTDLDIIMRTTCNANITEEGRVVVNCKRLSDTIQALDSGSEISISTEMENVLIEVGSFKSRIPTSDIAEYPPIDNMVTNHAVSFKAITFKELIDKTSFSISKETSRVDFTGELLTIAQNGIIQLVSTDGHRLSRIEADVTINGQLANAFERGIIIPGKGMAELSRNLLEGEIFIDVVQNKFIVEAQDLTICITLIAGQFPDFSKVIPQSLEHKAVIRREDFQKLLRRASIYASKTGTIRISIAPGHMEVSTYDQSNGCEMVSNVECEYDGNGVTAGFNWRYIDEILKVIGCDVVSFEVIDMDSPAVIRDVTTSRLDYIVMPMQL